VSDELYASAPTATSLGSVYRVCAGRVELDTTMYGCIRVPLDHIIHVAVRPPLPLLGAHPDDPFTPKLRCLRPDMARFVTHVGLERATGPYRLYRFAPPEPEAFVAALAEAIRSFQR